MSAYGIVRCGETDGSPDGPNGERCQRKDGHPGPHSDATARYERTTFWGGLIALKWDEITNAADLDDDDDAAS